VAFSKSPIGPYSKASEAFTESFTEGPTVEKVGSDYLIYFDAYQKFAYGAVRTKDFVHFEDISNKVNVPVGHKHGTIFKAPESLVQGLKANYEISQKQKKATAEKAVTSIQ
jgi:hypothetical protein